MFDNEMESMFCSVCRTFAKTDQDKKGPFVVGANKFKLENIKAHELSKSHILFKTCFDNQNKPVIDTQAGVCVQQLTSAQREKGDETNKERTCRGEALCPIHSL